MSHHHQRQNMKKPTGLEVYNDAAKILEELLEQHSERNLQMPRKVRRNKTDPKSETVVTNLSGSENALMRIQIKPIRHSRSLDEKLSQKDLNFLVRKSSQIKNGKQQRGGSDSSIETDDEQHHWSGKRNKKNFLKMAKERILQTFRRDQKSSAKTTKKYSADSTPSKKHSLKDKQVGKSTSGVHSQDKAYSGKDKYTEHTKARTNGSMGQSSEHSALKEGFIASFKWNKKSSLTGESISGLNDKQAQTFGRRKGSDGRSHDIRASIKKYISGEEELPAGQTSGTTNNLYPEQLLPDFVTEGGLFTKTPSSELKPELNSSKCPSPTQLVAYNQEHSTDKTGDVPSCSPLSVPIIISEDRSANDSHSRSSSPSSQRLSVAAVGPGSITVATSGASSGLLQPGSASDGTAVRILYRAHSNVLDSPGEDIEFMDIDNSVITVRKISSGSAELVRAVQITDAHFPDGEELRRRLHWQPGGDYSGHTDSVQPLIVAQGDCDSTGAASRGPSVHIGVATDSTQEPALGGLPVQTSMDREALYGKIAQKLIEMGDLYSTSASEHETGGAAAAQPPTLTDLENEIITCLRVGGDRYSRQLDESFEEVTQQTVQEAYQRFHSTVRNSMSSELSWDHVALLFYTTKGVVSAVGQGSRTATRVKEFTLQYITDTFASWIINQGGFDSVLSSEESDFDVD